MIPETLGPYRIVEILGAGAMGVVYRAVHDELQRSVAIKVPSIDSPELIARFVREGRILARLEHPNLVRVYDVGEAAGRPYIVFEFVVGHTLRALSAQGKLTPGVACRLVAQLLEGLGHAHAHQVLHRDVKAENALVTSEGLVKLADFGIARSEAESGGTQLGVLMGTPAYMSPEQAQGLPLDLRSDLYSAGVVLFELLTGSLPFSADDVGELLRMQIRQAPPGLRSLAPDASPALAAVVARALSKRREDRYPNAESFVAELKSTAGIEELETLPPEVLEAAVRAGGQTIAGVVAPSPDVGRAGSRTRSGVTRAASRTQVAAGKTAPGPGPTAPSRVGWRALLAVAALLSCGIVLVAQRTVRARPEPIAAAEKAAAFPDVRIEMIEWTYSAADRQLTSRWHLSRPVSTGFRIGSLESSASSASPSALGQATFRYVPGSPFRLAILRSDGGPEPLVTQAELLRDVRATGERLTRTLREFWSRTALTDRQFTNDVMRAAGKWPIPPSRKLVASRQIEALLRDRMHVLDAVRPFLALAPLFFDSAEIPVGVRRSLYKVLAPLELADSVTTLLGLPYAFGREIAGSTGSRLRQELLPDVKEMKNYGYDSRSGDQPFLLLGKTVPLKLPKPATVGELLVGAEYKFDSHAILKLVVSGLPVYFSRLPASYYTKAFEMPLERVLQDGMLLPQKHQKLAEARCTVAAHRLEPEMVSLDGDAAMEISQIHLSRPTLIDADRVWMIWLGFSAR
ncbi:MAG: serine/threonine protein kinase [Candidatus Wallbacteria bacterium]|nr:serine/threonine protein kinase [Candidatus Wallbacteria bacterium]